MCKVEDKCQVKENVKERESMMTKKAYEKNKVQIDRKWQKEAAHSHAPEQDATPTCSPSPDMQVVLCMHVHAQEALSQWRGGQYCRPIQDEMA